jgi:hypothetical protein
MMAHRHMLHEQVFAGISFEFMGKPVTVSSYSAEGYRERLTRLGLEVVRERFADFQPDCPGSARRAALNASTTRATRRDMCNERSFCFSGVSAAVASMCLGQEPDRCSS